jgi:hypothetical protein
MGAVGAVGGRTGVSAFVPFVLVSVKGECEA